MTPRTQTALPADKGMWRRLLRTVHPDTGGDAELFIWAQALREHVTGEAVEEHGRQVSPQRRSRSSLTFFEKGCQEASRFVSSSLVATVPTSAEVPFPEQ